MQSCALARVLLLFYREYIHRHWGWLAAAVKRQ